MMAAAKKSREPKPGKAGGAKKRQQPAPRSRAPKGKQTTRKEPKPRKSAKSVKTHIITPDTEFHADIAADSQHEQFASSQEQDRPESGASCQARGRPTLYRPEYSAIARKMTAMGATDRDLAEAFGVTVVTIWRWQTAHEDFCSALKIEKGEFDNRVERSLAQRAVGYSFPAVKIMQHNGVPVRVEYDEHVPPDPGAAKLWLSNRRPEQWRDVRRTELTGAGGAPIEVEGKASRSLLETARRIVFLMQRATDEQNGGPQMLLIDGTVE
jgi:hypothetical protein